MTDFTGKRVGQYQVIRKIGEGGMGQVYLARQESIGREVAIKFIVDRAANIAEFVERFEREAKICALLNHAHIVKVFDYGRAPNVAAAYIVMEYLKGGSLADIIHVKRPLPLTTVVELFEQIASALDYAHSKDIIHRDLKPLNVLIDEGRNAYISDFGLAKLRTASSLTNTGAMMGTAAYMSPEQWRGKLPLDERADIYSLGIMLFEMITGQLPFDAETMENMLYLHLLEPLPQINKMRTDVPQAVQQVIENATAKERNQRTSSCREILSELKKALAPISLISQAVEIQIVSQIEEDWALQVWDGSVDLPQPKDFDGQEQMIEKLVEAGVPPLTARIAPSHGNAYLTQKLMALEHAMTLIMEKDEAAAPEDKAMWSVKYFEKWNEYNKTIASFNMPEIDTRPVYQYERKTYGPRNPLGYSRTFQFQHSPDCLMAWRFAMVDECIASKKLEAAKTHLIAIVEGIEEAHPGTVADTVFTIRCVRNATVPAFLKALEHARSEYMPLIEAGHEACKASSHENHEVKAVV